MRRRNAKKRIAVKRALIRHNETKSNKVNMFVKALKLIQEYREASKSYNKNAVYASYGLSTGSPIFTPRHGKVKGYMRNSKGRVVR